MRPIRFHLVLLIIAALSQGSVAVAQDLYRVNFRAKCRTTGENGRLITAKITERDILRSVVGSGESASSLKRNYALAYNLAEDSVQAVRLDTREVLADVLLFSGGTHTSDGRKSERLTFLYLPGQDESIGTALLTEKLPGNRETTPSRLRITGRFQFVLGPDQTLGSVGSTESVGDPVETEAPATAPNPVVNPGPFTNTVPLPATTNGIIVPITPGVGAPAVISGGTALTNTVPLPGGLPLPTLPGGTNGVTSTNLSGGTGTTTGTGSGADTNLLAVTPVLPGVPGAGTGTNVPVLAPPFPGAGTVSTNLNVTITNQVVVTNVIVGGIAHEPPAVGAVALPADAVPLKATGVGRSYVYSGEAGVAVSAAENPDVNVCTATFSVGKRMR